MRPVFPLALFVTVLTCLLAGPADAAPLVTALTGFFTSVGFGAAFSASLAGFLVNTIASAALSRLQMALKKKPQAAGIKTEATQTGGTSPLRFILGRYATGGQLIAPPNSWGAVGSTPRSYLVYPVALSVIPGCSLQRIIINDRYVPLAAVPHSSWGRYTEGDFPGIAQVDYLNGAQTAADADMLAAFGSDPDRPWAADMVGSGLCWAKCLFRFSREHFNGLPSVRFEVLGIPLYDPRKDSTAGGSGPQRWADKSTWTQSTNNAVMIWNIMRGIEIAPDLIWGGGYDAEDLPAGAWFAAMNACDLPIDDGAAGSVPQFRAGMEVALDDEPLAVVAELLKACCGEMAEIGGYWDIRIGAPRLPAIFITDDDILTSQEQEQDPFPSLLDTFNGIAASYPEPESLWESKDAPPRYNAAWETEDGGRRLVAELELPACSWGEQVQRIMAAQIADHRRFRRHRHVLPPEAAVLSPLDTIGWTSTRYGYTAKLFEVRTMMDSLMTLRQGLALREVDGDDFAWAPGSLIPSPPAPAVTTPPAPQSVPGFAVTAATVIDAGSQARRSAIALSWDPAGATDARGIGWQLRLAGSAGDGEPGTHGRFSDGRVRLVGGILPATAYEIRAQLLVDRAVSWTAWTPVITPDIRIGLDDLAPDVAGTMEDTLAAAALAEAARAAAVAARTAAETARGLAQAAAVASTDARDAADAAAALALSSKTAAAASAADSATAKAASEAAKTAAETARTQAQTYATNAGNSASAAAGSASTASTKAAEAGDSATAAAANVVEAKLTAADLLPSDFRRDGQFWTQIISGAPGSRGNLLPAVTFVTDATEGRVAQVAAPQSSNVHIAPISYVAAMVGRRYRLTVRARHVGAFSGGSQTDALRLAFWGIPADYSAGLHLTTLSAAFAATNSWKTFVHEVVFSGPNPHLLPFAWINAAGFGAAGPTIQISRVKIEDITESTSAASSASASATSASAAAVSETNAATSASASQADRILAQTARGQAQTYATNAATSESNAAGSASTATTQAGVAAAQAGNAGNSATAAAGSASTAGTKATEAGNSATAAAASATAASTSAGQASTSASQAATSATTAGNSANSAATSASTAARVVAWSYPSDFAEDGRFWTGQLGGAPTARGALSASVSFVTDATEGRIAQVAAPLATNAIISGVGYVPAVVGRKYRLSVRARHVGPFAGGSETALRLTMRRVTAAWASGTDFVSTFIGTFAAPNTWQDFVLEGVYPGADPYFAWFTWCAAPQMGVAGPVIQVSRVRIEDVTAQAAATDAASAAATSATAATAAQSAAGASATAAATSATTAATQAGNASTSAGQAANSATSAAGSANTAAIQAGAAASSATTAGTHATAAAGSAALASTSAGQAGDYAAQALDYRNTAARLMSGGVSKNPVFNAWTATYPANVGVAPAGGTVAKVTSGVRYINALEVDASDAAYNGPTIYIGKTNHGLDCSLSPKAVLIRMEIEYVSGDLAASGAILRALWVDTASRVVDRALKDLINPTPGVVQTVGVYADRPASAVPGSATNFRVDYYGHTNVLGGTRAPLKVRIHRLDFEEVLAGSTTEMWQRAAVDFQGVQSAVVGFRAVAGSAGAELELVALTDPLGSPASLARLVADNILMVGTVGIELLNVAFLNGGRIRAEYLDIDRMLTILPGGSLSHGKTNGDSVTPGIFFGRDTGGFSFAASRISGSGLQQSIKLTESSGLQLRNAKFSVATTSPVVTQEVTVSTVKTSLPLGIKQLYIEGVGGGAAGQGVLQPTLQAADVVRWNGNPGGDTVVKVYDGTTLKETFTFPGAPASYPSSWVGANGENSAYGAGGSTDFRSGTYPAVVGGAGARGAGGGGGRSIYTSGGQHRWTTGLPGKAAAQYSFGAVDLSAYAAPAIEVTIGAGGAAHTSAPANSRGGAGGNGYVKYSHSGAIEGPADVVPLTPTATGTFVTAAGGAGAFPNLGAGLWMLHMNTATGGVGLGYVTLSPGNTVRAYETGTVTLLSSQTPTYASAYAGLTVYYAFYSMGNWG